MEGNTNWESNEQGRDSLTKNANDWRSQLDPDLRERVISTIVAKLMILFPKHDQNALTLIATNFEDKMYGIAKDKSDYLRIIVAKIHFIEKKSAMMQSSSSVNGTNTHDSGGQVVLNPGQSVPTSLPYIQTPTCQQNSQRNLNALGSSVLQTQVPINVSMAQNVNTQISEGVHINLSPVSQPQNSNYMVQHQINQQLLKDKIRHGNLRPPHMQQQTQPLPQQHLQSLLKQHSHQSFPQSSVFSILPSSGQQNSQLLPRHQCPTQRVYSSMVLPSQDKVNVPSMQQKLLTSRQSIGEQQGPFRPSYQAMAPQNDLQTMHQQHFNNTEVFPSQQQKTIPGIQSGDFNALGSSLLCTQGQEVGQFQTYQPQFPMQQQPQNKSLKNDTQKFQASTSLHKTQNITDLLNFPHQLLRTPLANPSTSQDSTGNGSGGDWQEETYKKIKALRENYFLLLSTMRQKLTEKLRQAESLPPQKKQSELTEKLRRMKASVEQVLVFLNVHRRNISEEHRDKFSLYEESILKMTKNHTAIRRPMQQQQGQFPPSQTHQTALQSQVPQVNVSLSLLKDEMNSRLTPSNENRALPSVSGVMTSQTSVPHSFEIKPKLEPRDENNTLASSRNVVLPSIKQNPSSNQQVIHSNINPVQSSMLQQKQKQFRYRQMQHPLLHRKQKQQKQSQQANQANQQPQRPTSQQGVNNSSNQCQLLKAVTSPDMFSNISPSASSQSSGPPFVVSSLVTYFAPSTIPRDPEKTMSLESPVSHSQSPASFGVEIKSTLDSSSKPSTLEQPPVSLPPEPIAERAIDRLIKACQSSSPKSLAESFSEISSVVSMVDRFAGSRQQVVGSRGGLGEDLSKRKNFRFHLMTDGEISSNKRMKRSINALPLETASRIESCNQLTESEVDSTASSGSKVNKIESGCVLMQEIKEINSTLLETMVEICDEDVYRSKVTSGTIVMCSYDPVALTDTFKAHYYSGKISQIQPVRLLVPANYPNRSPTLLEGISFESSHNHEDLSAKTRSRFSLFLRKLTEPVSLKKMAQAWTDCARATMVEYATRHGGGTFSSKYGAWDTVLRAS